MQLAETPHGIPEADPGQVIVLCLRSIAVLQGGIEVRLVTPATPITAPMAAVHVVC
jgi:hypothetical protein